MSQTVRIRTRPETMPIPKWVWVDYRWVLSLRPSRKKWDRPILPPHETKTPRTPLRSKGISRPLWLMGPQDRERAEVVLALYLKSMGIESWEDFKQSGPGYGFYSYPGTPIHYPESEVVRVACCLGKNYRYVSPERCLLNPVDYCFCLAHWHQFLRESQERDRSIVLPDLVVPQ